MPAVRENKDVLSLRWHVSALTLAWSMFRDLIFNVLRFGMLSNQRVYTAVCSVCFNALVALCFKLANHGLCQRHVCAAPKDLGSCCNRSILKSRAKCTNKQAWPGCINRSPLGLEVGRSVHAITVLEFKHRRNLASEFVLVGLDT